LEVCFNRCILLVVLGMVFLLGPRKLPELGKGVGEGIHRFKSGVQQDSQDRPRRPGPIRQIGRVGIFTEQDSLVPYTQ